MLRLTSIIFCLTLLCYMNTYAGYSSSRGGGGGFRSSSFSSSRSYSAPRSSSFSSRSYAPRGSSGYSTTRTFGAAPTRHYATSSGYGRSSSNAAAHSTIVINNHSNTSHYSHGGGYGGGGGGFWSGFMGGYFGGMMANGGNHTIVQPVAVGQNYAQQGVYDQGGTLVAGGMPNAALVPIYSPWATIANVTIGLFFIGFVTFIAIKLINTWD